MALYTRFVSTVDAATGNDTRGSGSSASIKDSDLASGTSVVVTNVVGGSTVTRTDALAFAGPPVASVDTFHFKDASALTENIYHIAAISADNKTLTLAEEPASALADAADIWSIGGYFATIGRAAGLVTPSSINSGADDHVYVKAGAGYSGTATITFGKVGSKSRALVYEGYTTTPGDGGQATYQITATASTGFTVSGNFQHLRNFIVNTIAAVNFTAFNVTGSRASLSNCYGHRASGTSGTAGINASNGLVFRCRTNTPQNVAAFRGIVPSVSASLLAFSIAHDAALAGCRMVVNTTALFTIVDTANINGESGGWEAQTNAATYQLVGCIAYNSGGTRDGCFIADTNTQNPVIFCSIFANNGGYGINRTAIVALAGTFLEFTNDFFSNASGARNNMEDATAYDATPTDKTVDPQWTDAPNQNFSVGTNLRAAATIVFQVGGTTYLDMGALQRQEAAGGGPLPARFIGPAISRRRR